MPKGVANKQRVEMPRSPGRPKGSPNKTTALLKDAILKAADEAGGEEGLIGYLKGQATANPQSFLPLLGKVLPLQLTGDGGGPIQTEDVSCRDAPDEVLRWLASQRQADQQAYN